MLHGECCTANTVREVMDKTALPKLCGSWIAGQGFYFATKIPTVIQADSSWQRPHCCFYFISFLKISMLPYVVILQ